MGVEHYRGLRGCLVFANILVVDDLRGQGNLVSMPGLVLRNMKLLITRLSVEEMVFGWVCVCVAWGLRLGCSEVRGVVYWVGQRKVGTWVARYRLRR